MSRHPGQVVVIAVLLGVSAPLLGIATFVAGLIALVPSCVAFALTSWLAEGDEIA